MNSTVYMLMKSRVNKHIILVYVVLDIRFGPMLFVLIVVFICINSPRYHRDLHDVFYYFVSSEQASFP